MGWIDDEERKYRETQNAISQQKDLIKSRIGLFNEQLEDIRNLSKRIPPPTVSYGTRYEVSFKYSKDDEGHWHDHKDLYTFEFFTSKAKVEELNAGLWGTEIVSIGIVNTLTINYYPLVENYIFIFQRRFLEYDDDDRDYTYESGFIDDRIRKRVNKARLYKQIDLLKKGQSISSISISKWENILGWISFRLTFDEV